MGGILQNWRVIGATLFSTVLIIGAYALARGVSSPPVAEASTETALLQSIASRDSDADGLPDWEEALYGTDPHNSDTFKLGMTDGEAVAKGLVVPKAIADVPTATSTPAGRILTDPTLPIPAEGTITAAFAKNFFTLYLNAVQASGDGNLSESDMQNVASEALSQLAQSVTLAPDFKSMQNLTVTGSGSDALRAFAVSAEAVFLTNKGKATNTETAYLKDVLDNNDTTALSNISSIAKVYRSVAVGLIALPVPTELANDDLVLINAMARMSEITEDFTRVSTKSRQYIHTNRQYLQNSRRYALEW